MLEILSELLRQVVEPISSGSEDAVANATWALAAITGVVTGALVIISIISSRDTAKKQQALIDKQNELIAPQKAIADAQAETLRKQEELITEQKNKNQYDVLFQLFSRLNDNHKRNTRIRIVRFYEVEDHKTKLKIMKELDPLDKSGIHKQTSGKSDEDQKILVETYERESVNEVKWDFQQIGSLLINEDSRLKKPFLAVYWRIVIICWKVIEKQMENKSQIQKNDLSSFEILYEAAMDYGKNLPEGKEDLKNITDNLKATAAKYNE